MRAFFFIIVIYLADIAVNAQDRITGKNFASRSEVIAQHGMACTSQPLATQVALDILKKGGNALDGAFTELPNRARMDRRLVIDRMLFLEDDRFVNVEFSRLPAIPANAGFLTGTVAQ